MCVIPGAGQADGRMLLRRHAAADERAGMARVDDQQLFALNVMDERVELRGAQGRLRLAVAQQQIDLAVVGGGENAVRTQIEDGQIVFVAFGECAVDGRAQRFDCADGAIITFSSYFVNFLSLFN